MYPMQLLHMQARLEPKPSRVLHFRGVPLDVTDSEILQLTLPFGNVTNLVVSKKKNQVNSVNVHSSRRECSFGPNSEKWS